MKILAYLKTIVLFCSILFYVPSAAQLKADAGEDRIVCMYTYGEKIEIGGSPTASGGVEPYTYSWSGEVWVSLPYNYLGYATNDLDDPSISNPVYTVFENEQEWSKFYLKVEDAIGNIAFDTIVISNANIWRQLFPESYYIIIKGDSIQLKSPFFENSHSPLYYSITPSYGLTNSNDIYGWARPDSSVRYYIQAENSVGCVSPKKPYMNIKVVDSKTDSIYKAKIDSLNNLLVGEWEWYGSGGGEHGGGFGGPEKNGYTVKIVIEKDPLTDSLLFWNYVNDTLETSGKTRLNFWKNRPTIYELYSILPLIHIGQITFPGMPGDPEFPNWMINVEFDNNDSIRLYGEMMADFYEVYYKRLTTNGIRKEKIAESGIHFYPNPAQNSITISTALNTPVNKIELFDLSGRKVKIWSDLTQSENVLQIESVLPGIYVLKIETEFGIETKKLVVQ